MLEVQAMVDTACAKAGSDDFGPDTWREGLEILVGALSSEGSLNDLGRHIYTGQIVEHLVNRLEIEQCYRLHPEIEDERIVAPLFGLGMPRTGSTALSFLLANDCSRRSLRTWESSAPCPPPEKATEDTDPRIAQCQAGVDMSNQMFPDFAGMLPSSATGPSECLHLMALDFRSEIFEGMALIPSYTEWLLSCDMTPVYRYHARVLKLLQWHCPPTRWWLKTPAHMASITALDTVYPDARFVMTHRDIGSVLPSLCALKDALSRPVVESLDLEALGRHEVSLWSESLRRLIDFRDAVGEARFYDVAFTSLQADPMAAMEQLYGEMGDPLDDETRRRMMAWWDESARDRRKGAKPDLAAYGIDRDSLRTEFAFYHERFDVASDRAAVN
jgi:hypothetical protein